MTFDTFRVTFQLTHLGNSVALRKPIPNSNRDVITVRAIRPEDAGAYICAVENELGGPLESPPANVTVLSKSYFHNMLSSKLLNHS